MIITKVRACAIEAAFPKPFAYLRKWYDKRTTIILEIETDKGLAGRGGCQGQPRPVLQAIAMMTPWLIGEDPLRPSPLRQAIYARLAGQDDAVHALSGIYAALWDIKDKHHLLSITPAAWSGRIARQTQSLPAHPFESDVSNPAMPLAAHWPQSSAA